MTERVVTQEEVVSHLAQVGRIETWEQFLEALHKAESLEIAIGILHNGASRILYRGFNSENLDPAEVTRRGLRFYLNLAEPGQVVDDWADKDKRASGKESSLPSSVIIANRVCKLVLDKFLPKLTGTIEWCNASWAITSNNLEEILLFLCNPHHVVFSEPYLRKTKEFLLELWEAQEAFMKNEGNYDHCVCRWPFIAVLKHKPNLLIDAMINAGLTDVLLQVSLTFTRLHYRAYLSTDILKERILAYWQNHPYLREHSWSTEEYDSSNPYSYIPRILTLHDFPYHESLKAAAQALAVLNVLR
ncbi:MAG: hypothetical protein WC242_01020 [Candidatus Paceibacterota bacterium]|jgi:hypothetical protein